MVDVLTRRIEAEVPEALAGLVLTSARAMNVSESEIVRRALVQYLNRTLPIARSGEADDDRSTRIREYLGNVLARARNWTEVQTLLAEQGLAYSPRGGGLVVIAKGSNRILSKGSEVGPSYRQLVRRFGHFPGHPHIHIARKVAEEEPSLIDAGDRFTERSSFDLTP